MLAISPKSGYEIKQAIARSTQFFWSESDGQIYPALAKCLEEGLIEQVKEPNSKEGRQKKIYSISQKGEQHLAQWLKESVQSSLIRNELLLKLFFGANVPVEESIQHLRHHQRETREELKTFEAIKLNIEEKHSNSKHRPYWLLTVNHGISITKTELEWCAQSIQQLVAIS